MWSSIEIVREWLRYFNAISYGRFLLHQTLRHLQIIKNLWLIKNEIYIYVFKNIELIVKWSISNKSPQGEVRTLGIINLLT